VVKPTRRTPTERGVHDQVGDLEPYSKQQHEWRKILFWGAATGRRLVACAARFKQKFGIWPQDAKVTPTVTWADKDRLVAERYPQFDRYKV
jgi:hypothetical protein